MKKVVEYQPIVDEFIREQRERPLIFCSPRRRKPTQRTLADLQNMHLPDTTPIEAEWTDAAGYHRAPVTGVWESESGSVVLTVGAEQIVPEHAGTERTG